MKLLYCLKQILFILLISFICLGCNDENIDGARQNSLLRVSFNTEDSRAVIDGNTFPVGSRIGMTLVNEETLGAYEGAEYFNIFTEATKADEKLTWLLEKEILMFDSNAQAIAYYPYDVNTDYTAIPVEAGITDYMYSGWVTGLNNENNNASFTMKHAMTAIKISIKKGNYDGDGVMTAINIKANSLGTAGVLNAETGVLSSITGNGNWWSNSVEAIVTDQETIYEYMMLPVNDNNDKFITLMFVVDGKEYYKSIELDKCPKQGEKLKFSFVLSKENLQLLQMEIIPWYITEKEESGLDVYSSYLALSYNVTTTDAATRLLGSSFATYVSSYISEMIIDGVSVKPVASYTFSTTGKHEVKIRFKDETKIPCHPYTTNGSTYYYYGAFNECTNINEILYFPTQLKTIDRAVFNGCTGLTGMLNIPESVTSIGNNAFSNCTGLTSLNLGSCVQSIRSYAFSNCTGLKGTLTIPNSVMNIGEGAFNGCTGLTGIVLGTEVTGLGNKVFQGCSGLREITSLATSAPAITAQTFFSIKSNGTLIVPTGCIDAYATWMGTSTYYLGYYKWTIQEATE